MQCLKLRQFYPKGTKCSLNQYTMHWASFCSLRWRWGTSQHGRLLVGDHSMLSDLIQGTLESAELDGVLMSPWSRGVAQRGRPWRRSEKAPCSLQTLAFVACNCAS